MKALAVVIMTVGLWAFAQELPPSPISALTLNPATGCMEARFASEQPEAERTIPAQAVLEALQRGHCVRLQAAIIQGDLDFTTLPVVDVDEEGDELIRIKRAFVAKGTRFSGKLHAVKRAQGARVRFEGPVVLSDSVLPEVDLRGASFAQTAHFENASFGHTRMQQTAFLRGATFRGARFEKPAFLIHVSVADSLDLSGAHFFSLVRFFGLRVGGEIDLSRSRFEATADLSGWQVGDVNMSSVEFVQSANMSNGTWRGTGTLAQARFTAGVDFSSTHFQGSMNFHGAQFAGSTRFFETTFAETTRFQRARFQGSAVFSQARFLKEADFSGARFNGETLFAEAQFSGMTKFIQTVFAGNVRFREALFRDWVRFAGSQFQHELDLQGAAFLSPAPPDWQEAQFARDVKLQGVSSVASWHLDPEQLRYFPMQEGAHPFLPRETLPNECPSQISLASWLLAVLVVEVALLLLMNLR